MKYTIYNYKFSDSAEKGSYEWNLYSLLSLPEIYYMRKDEMQRFVYEDKENVVSVESKDLFKKLVKETEDELIKLREKLTDDVVKDFLEARKRFCRKMIRKPNAELAEKAGFMIFKDVNIENYIKRNAKNKIKAIEAVEEFYANEASKLTSDEIENET